MPVPNFSGRREKRLAAAYDSMVAAVAPTPGSTPTTKPTIEPLRSSRREATASLNRGMSDRKLKLAASAIDRVADAGEHGGETEQADCDDREIEAVK